jgi:SAM-dependent methyltransferase
MDLDSVSVADEVAAPRLGRMSEPALAAEIEPFDSFWEGPEEVERGYAPFHQFYRVNYLPHMPPARDARVLVISCGPGYFAEMLRRHGYQRVLGIDSDPSKVEHARRRGLDCRVARAFEFLGSPPGAGTPEPGSSRSPRGRRPEDQSFDAIVCEQELNHLTKEEMRTFLRLVHDRLVPGGTLIVHGLNGANPITGAEALAQNIDHFNTFTEYSLRQVLGHAGFAEITVFPLNLYVFYSNPLNYVAWALAATLDLLFRVGFILYGKSNRIFTKKIGAACRKPAPAG